MLESQRVDQSDTHVAETEGNHSIGHSYISRIRVLYSLATELVHRSLHTPLARAVNRAVVNAKKAMSV